MSLQKKETEVKESAEPRIVSLSYFELLGTFPDYFLQQETNERKKDKEAQRKRAQLDRKLDPLDKKSFQGLESHLDLLLNDPEKARFAWLNTHGYSSLLTLSQREKNRQWHIDTQAGYAKREKKLYADVLIDRLRVLFRRLNLTLESKAQWRLWDDQVLEKELQVLDHALHSAYAVDLTLSIGPSLSLEFKGFSSGKIQSQKEFLGLIQWKPHDPAGEYEIKARESLVRKAANLLNPQTLDALFSEKFPDFKSDEDGYLTLSLVDLFAHFKMYSQSSTDKIRLQNEKEYEQVKKNAVAQFGYSETDTLIENEGFSIQFTFVDNGWSALIRMKPEAVQLRRKEYLQDIQAQADEFVKNKVANLITDAVESGEFGEGDAYPADFMGAVIRSIQAGELGTELRKRQDEEQGSQYF